MIYTILDCETTGTSTEYDDILSFGFIRINSDFEIKASGILYFYRESFNLSNPRANAVHKLSKEFLMGHAGEFADNIKKMYSLCYHSTIIGKNSNRFDIPIIKNFIRKHVSTLKPLEVTRALDLQIVFSPYFKQKTGESRAGTLTDYVNLLGVTEDDIRKVYDSLPTKDGANFHAHGAMYDCIATLLVFKEYCKIYNLQP